jgi:hypothetical protein
MGEHIDITDLATKEDLRFAQTTLLKQIETGFAGINTRLDQINGRVVKREVEAGQHDVRLGALERNCPLHRRGDPSGADFRDRRATREDSRRISERDVKIAAIAIGTAFTVVAFLWKALPVVVAAVSQGARP